jgi:putative transposase
MNDIKSLSHSKGRCKYYIVFAPKYRRQGIYGRIKAERKCCGSYAGEKG